MNEINKKKSRTLVNLIGIPLLLTIIYLGNFYFTTLIFFAIFVCTKELSDICEKINISIQTLWLYLFYILLYITHFIPKQDIGALLYIDLLSIAVLLICLSELFRNTETPLRNISVTVFTLIWIGIFLNSLVLIREKGYEITYLLFLSVWICDTVAFWFGMKFGKSKILPAVSPKKTWVGSIAGLASSVIFMMILYRFNYFTYHVSHIDAILLGFITGVFAQLGDFAESLLKREANIKDTSNFLRGHGGILDRFDSLTFAAPVTLIYCNYFIIIGK